MPGYTDLRVWQRARTLTQLVYRLIEHLPPEERYNLSDQLRRSSVSIVSNIAEGSRRLHKNEKRQYYAIAYGSASEVESQIIVVKDVYRMPDELMTKIQQTLQSLLPLLNRLLARFL